MALPAVTLKPIKPGSFTFSGFVVSAAMVAALAALLKLLQKTSGPMVVVTGDSRVHACRLVGPGPVPVGIAVDRSWSSLNKDNDDSFTVDDVRLSADGTLAATWSTGLNDAYVEIVDMASGAVLFDVSDVTVLDYVPTGIKSTDADVPASLADMQSWLDAEMTKDGEKPPFPILIATLIQENSDLKAARCTVDGGWLITVGVRFSISRPDGTDFGPGEEADFFWFVLKRVGDSLVVTSQGFAKPPPETFDEPAAPVEIALGAELPGGGRQLLLGGKAAKLPTALKSGVRLFRGPWA